MNPSEINRESDRLFRSLLMPNWADRSQQDQQDYGIDFEIELIAPDEKATGVIFKVQLKGTSVPKYDEGGRLVFADASVERFRYYIHELKIPLVYVVCDISAGACFWSKVQGNRELESAFNDAAAKNQKTFTVKFSPSRKLLKTAESSQAVIEAIEEASETITLRGLKSISSNSVREYVGHDPDIEAIEKRFRLIAGIVANESIRKMIQSGDLSSASKKAKDLLESESEPPEVRLHGGLSFIQVATIDLRRRGAPDAGMVTAKVKLGVASRMLEISRQKTCEMRMKRYVCLYTRAARMQINGRVAMALALSEKTQRLQGATIAGPITQLQRLQVSALVSRDFFRLRDGLYRLGSNRHFSVMPHALSEIIAGTVPFVAALRILGHSDLADAYVDALFDFLPFCIGIIRKFDNKNDIVELLSSLGTRFLVLADISEKSSMPGLLLRFEQALEGEPAFECLNEVLIPLRDLAESVRLESDTPSEPSMDELRVYISHQAAALGINLNDPNDEFANVVKIGLEDLDPTRVVKNCHHIHVMTTFYGAPAEMLGLPTAGLKRIGCLKHGHSIEALSLDAAYDTFAKVWPWDEKGIRCENCPDKVPHPDGWQWSYEWNAQQHAKYQELIKERT